MITFDLDEGLAALRYSARKRRGEAMRPGTRKNLMSCQTLFVQFCLMYGIPVEAPSIDDVGAFTELLVESKLSVATIKNYCVAIKTLYAEEITRDDIFQVLCFCYYLSIYIYIHININMYYCI